MLTKSSGGGSKLGASSNVTGRTKLKMTMCLIKEESSFDLIFNATSRLKPPEGLKVKLTWYRYSVVLTHFQEQVGWGPRLVQGYYY